MYFCKEIVIIIYNYIHRDFMKSVITEYKKLVKPRCGGCMNGCGCDGGVCNSCIIVYVDIRYVIKVAYNYRDSIRCDVRTIYDINGKATKYELPPKYYYSL